MLEKLNKAGFEPHVNRKFGSESANPSGRFISSTGDMELTVTGTYKRVFYKFWKVISLKGGNNGRSIYW